MMPDPTMKSPKNKPQISCLLNIYEHPASKSMLCRKKSNATQVSDSRKFEEWTEYRSSDTRSRPHCPRPRPPCHCRYHVSAFTVQMSRSEEYSHGLLDVLHLLICISLLAIILSLNSGLGGLLHGCLLRSGLWCSLGLGDFALGGLWWSRGLRDSWCGSSSITN